MPTKPKTWTIEACQECGAEFYVARWRLERGETRFCSRQCRAAEDTRRKNGQ